MSGRLASTALLTTAARSTRSLRSSIFPPRCATRRAGRRPAGPSAAPAARSPPWPTAAAARGGPLARRICTALRIGASGLRSSWASIARNSSLRRSASLSAASRFAFSMAMTARCGQVLRRAPRSAGAVASGRDSAVTKVSTPIVPDRERQRHADVGLQAQLADQRWLRRRPAPRWREVARGSWPSSPARRCAGPWRRPYGADGRGRVAAERAPGPAAVLGRVGVGDGEPAHRAARLLHVHRAPVGERRHGQAGDPLQRALVVGQLGQGDAWRRRGSGSSRCSGAGVSSARRRSVTSRKTRTAPTTFPARPGWGRRCRRSAAPSRPGR